MGLSAVRNEIDADEDEIDARLLHRSEIALIFEDGACEVCVLEGRKKVRNLPVDTHE